MLQFMESQRVGQQQEQQLNNNKKREKLERGSQREGERRGHKCEDAGPLTPSPLVWGPPTLNVRIVLGAKNFVLCLTPSFPAMKNLLLLRRQC